MAGAECFAIRLVEAVAPSGTELAKSLEEDDTVAKKLPGSNPSNFWRPLGEERACASCGALASKGGCEDPTACVQALANREREYARDVEKLLDRERTPSLPLLMAGFEALDLLSIGLVITTDAGVLLMANSVADQLLESHDGLELTPAGVFQAMKGCGPALTGLLRQAIRSEGTAKRPDDGSVVAVHRPSGKRPLTLLVRAVKPSGSNRMIKGPSALVFILDPQLPVDAPDEELRQLYGLTSTEARLANLLMDGKTLDESCVQLGIRRSTGRTHLQHLFEKVGVQRQSELISLLLKSIGLVRVGIRDKRRSRAKSAEDLQEAFVKTLMNRVFRATGGL